MKKQHQRLLLSAALLLAAFHAVPHAQAAPLALHKALYDLRMTAAEPGAGINNVSGKMYFEQDETCEAWTTEHRFTTAYQYADTRPLIETSHYVAFETKDGKGFSFNARREQDGELTEQIRGSVVRNADGTGKATYFRPDDVSYDLPAGFLLPTAQTMETIRRARAGETFFKDVIFDGTDEQGPVEATTFIGKKATADEIKKIAAGSAKIDARLLTPDAWHVRLAVFPLTAVEESVPAYEMDMLVHDNGVISHVLVDYKTFSVEQKLAALDQLPAPKKCD